MYEQPFFRPPKFLDQNDPLIEHFWSLVGNTGGSLHSVWLLAMNQVAAAHVDTAHLLPIGSHDPIEQRGVEFLGSSLNVLRVKPLAYLIERVQVHAPDLTRLCGKFLQENLEHTILWILRDRLGIKQPLYRWQGEYLTAENQIWLGPHFPELTIAGRTIHGGTITVIPDNVSGKHVLEARTYVNAFSPPEPRGRPRKPPGAPRTRRPNPLDAEAIRAWELGQQDADLETIARTLWPGIAMTSEQERRGVRQKVRRRLHRGRVLTSPPPDGGEQADTSAKKNRHDKN